MEGNNDPLQGWDVAERRSLGLWVALWGTCWVDVRGSCFAAWARGEENSFRQLWMS